MQAEAHNEQVCKQRYSKDKIIKKDTIAKVHDNVIQELKVRYYQYYK